MPRTQEGADPFKTLIQQADVMLRRLIVRANHYRAHQSGGWVDWGYIAEKDQSTPQLDMQNQDTYNEIAKILLERYGIDLKQANAW